MDVDLNEIEGLLAKATPGEWFEGGWGGICQKPSHKDRSHPGPRGDDPCVYTKVKYDCGGIASDNGDAVVSTEYDELVLSDGDAALIVALRNAAPSLIATAREAEALRAENARLLASVKGWAADAARLNDNADYWRQECHRLRETLAAYTEYCGICHGRGSFIEEDAVTGADLWRDCPGCTPARAALKENPNAG